MLKANIGILAKSDVIIWQGWVVYSWEMGHVAYLFYDKPQKEDGRWWFDNAVEGISPDFLLACGVDLAMPRASEEDPPDGMSRDRAFYYGKESDGHGSHNPLCIKLTMPRALLEQLGINTDDIPSTAKCNEPHKRK